MARYTRRFTVEIVLTERDAADASDSIERALDSGELQTLIMIDEGVHVVSATVTGQEIIGTEQSGYHQCACPLCFDEIIVGYSGDLCDDCGEHDCTHDAPNEDWHAQNVDGDDGGEP